MPESPRLELTTDIQVYADSGDLLNFNSVLKQVYLFLYVTEGPLTVTSCLFVFISELG